MLSGAPKSDSVLRFEGGKHDTYYAPGSETLNALVRIASGSGEQP